MRDIKEEQKSERMMNATQKGLGKALMAWNHVTTDVFRGEAIVTGLSMKLSTTSDEWLVVVRGLSQDDGTPLVGFHAGVTPAEALAGAAERVLSGSIKWRIDEYATQNR